MVRRLHAPHLFIGDVPLDSVQAKHARDVLRLTEGTIVEVFNSQGDLATGPIRFEASGAVIVQVASMTHQADAAMRIVVAAAIPKGERADWMIEKLSELGVASFIPLAAERSVTLPQGRSKFERWGRIATESAKQSRRAGVMTIESLTSVDELLRDWSGGYVLSTAQGSVSLADAIETTAAEILIAVGPEGGWTERELTQFQSRGYVQVALTSSILRTETAAIAGAAIVAVLGRAKNTGHGR